MDPAELIKKLENFPKHVILFGAGASYGSDPDILGNALLPPLGDKLFETLRKEPGLKSWNSLAPVIVEEFKKNRFEVAMDNLESNEEWCHDGWRRDLDLARFFSKFSIRRQSVYHRLAMFISLKARTSNWSGAFITLNYERLLEEALLSNSIFPVSKGVTFYDTSVAFDNFKLMEVCYPHGSCQFFIPQNFLTGGLGISNVTLTQTDGVNHLLIKEHIPITCDNKNFPKIPMICRYQSSKEPTAKNYFIDLQKSRTIELIDNAKTITIIGVLCSPQDNHLWEPLEKTKATIYYVEPYPNPQKTFKEWTDKCGKKEGVTYNIIPKTFDYAFSEIIKVNGI